MGIEEESTLLGKISGLPTPSPVLQRVCAATSDPDSSASHVVEALKQDPALVSRVLRLANSAYMGVPRTVSSLQNAVVLLGQKRVRALVMSASTLSTLHVDASAGFTLEGFWRHSMVVGMIAESVGKHLRRYSAVAPDEMFSAAIMHDLGKLVLGIYEPQRMAAAIEASRRDGIPLHQAESNELRHTKAGKLLADYWNFPADITDAVALHHTPSEADNFTQLVAVVHIADAMAHSIGYQVSPGEKPPLVDSTALSAVVLPLERLRVIAEDVLEQGEKLEALLEAVA